MNSNINNTILIFLFLFISIKSNYAQTDSSIVAKSDDYTGYETKNLLYRNEKDFGIIAHTSGFGFNWQRSWNITGYKKRTLNLEFITIRHNKEQKRYHPYHNFTKGYFYGKQNSLSCLHAGFGFQKIHYSRDGKKTVQIRSFISGGLSIGILKPVYLEIIDSITIEDTYYSSQKYNPNRHNVNNILGRSSFIKGIEESKLWPGAYLKAGIGFEYGENKESIKQLDTGIIIDAYTKAVPIMAVYKNNPIFVGLFLRIAYGKRWY